MQEFLKSVLMQGRAIQFIFRNKLKWTMLVPFFVFVVLGFVGFLSFHEFVDYICMKFGIDSFFSGFELLKMLAHIFFFFLFGILGSYIVLIVMSPFLAYVSEKTEKILTGKDYPFDLRQFIKDVARGILLAIRNSIIELLLEIGILLIGCIPLIGMFSMIFVTGILMLFVSTYFYGFSFIDYTNERRKLSIEQSVRFVRDRKGTACGQGFVFALLLYIPFVGAFLSCFWAIIATVAATIELVEDEQLKTLAHRQC